MKTLLTPMAVILLLAAALPLAACNTVAGAGQDVSSVGHGVTHGADAVQNSIRNGR